MRKFNILGRCDRRRQAGDERNNNPFLKCVAIECAFCPATPAPVYSSWAIARDSAAGSGGLGSAASTCSW
jgi:hypothetical protein